MLLEGFENINNISLFTPRFQQVLNLKITFADINDEGFKESLVDHLEILELDVVADFGYVLFVKDSVGWKESWDKFLGNVDGDDLFVKGVRFWDVDVY